VEIASRYDYKTRSDKTARKAERLLQGWLAKAIPAATADMRAYIDSKLEQRARQFSGARGAA
jgi:cytidylate kinase